MSLILASRPNVFSGSPLDRAAHLRDEEAWIAAKLNDPDTLFAPVWRAKNLVRRQADGAPEAVFITGEAARLCRMHGGAEGASSGAPWAFLGLKDGVPLFCVDLSQVDDPIPLLPPEFGSFEELRTASDGLPGSDSSVLAHARGLMHWRTRHGFCGVCGGPAEPRSAGHVLRCTQCKADHFPRTDPAVIMLVIRGDLALLGHSKRFSGPFFSTLAGFVEPGETLEEAVAREVFEEVGVRVGRVHYHSSQPWPFPASIMLGFYAEATTEEIQVDGTEVVEARWFTRAQLRHPREHGIALPGKVSIARALIEDWIAAG